MVNNYFKKVKILFPFFIVLFLFFTNKINSQCAGVSNTITICDKELDPTLQTYNLFDQLGPDALIGGIWAVNNPINENALNSTTGILDLWAITRNGTHSFTYTNNNCNESSIITVQLGGYPGENNIDGGANACSDDTNVNLFSFLDNEIDELSADINGVWEGDINAMPFVSEEGLYDASELGPGIYTFTYTTNAIENCISETATVILEVHRAPVSGETSDFIVCETDDLSIYTNFNLFDRLNGEDTNGIWTELGTSQITDPLDSFINIEELYANNGPGAYEFSYTVFPNQGVCLEQTSIVRISILGFSAAFDINDYCDAGILVVDILTTGSPISYDLTYEIRDTNTNDLIFTETRINANSFILDPSPIIETGNYTITATAITNLNGVICDTFEVESDTFTVYAPTASIDQVCFEKDDIAEISIVNNTDANGILINATQSYDYIVNYTAQFVDPVTFTSGTYTTNNITITNTITFVNGAAMVPIDFSLFDFSPLDDFIITSANTTFSFINENDTALNCINLIFPTDLVPEDVTLNINLDSECDATEGSSVVVAPVIFGGEYNITYEVTRIENNEILVSGSRIVTGGTITDDLQISTLEEGNYMVTLRSIQNDNTPCRTQREFELTKFFSIAGIPEPPTLTAATQSFCTDEHLPNGPTIADITVATATTGNTLMWYESATATDVLDATEVLENGDYFVAANDSNNECEDSERVSVQISINTTAIPTSTNNTPTFCGINNTTLESIIITAENGGTIIWYDSPTAGNLLPSSTILLDGTNYYAAERNGICESDDRLPITVTIVSPSVTLQTNTFCASPEDTIASIQSLASTETNFDLVWYLGDIIITDTTTLLTQNTTYSVTSRDPVSGCESERNSITVSITSPITSNDFNPFFCMEDDATIALLDATAVNGGQIIWYANNTDTIELPLNTTLENGESYFVAERNGTCESIRTEFTPNIITSPVPINTIGNPICFVNQQNTIATIADLGNSGLITTDENFDLIWFDNFTNGNILPSTTQLEEGIIYYVASIHPASGCESELIAITVTTVSTINSTNTTPSFCGVNTFTLADLDATTVNTATTLIWYDSATGGNELASNTPLEEGVNFYYAVERNGSCESNRLEFEVTVVDPKTPVNIGDSLICANAGDTIANIAANFSTDPENTLIWFDANTNSIDVTTILEQNTTYQVASTFENSGCISDLLEFTINITSIPTANVTTLSFCGIDTTTLADLDVTANNGGNLVWYDSPIAGNIIENNILLETATYYVAEKINNCESDRLAFNITVNSPQTPILNGVNPICVTTGTTLLDLESSINFDNSLDLIWFDAPENGNRFTNTDVVTNNTSYYVATIDNATNCESDRIEIIVSITSTATTTNENPIFCSSDNPTISDLQLEVVAPNGGELIWYDSLASTIALNNTTPLTNNTSYFVEERNANCGSLIRLQLNVTIVTPPTPIFEGETALCALSQPTVLDLQEQIQVQLTTSPLSLTSINESIFSNSYELVWYDSQEKTNELTTSDELSEDITYFVVVRDIATQCEGEGIQISVTLSNCDPEEFTFFIPDGFSPNNDGTNDTYFIPNIQYFYPNYTYEIFNRYGQSLFKGDINNNQWDGTNNGANTESTTGVYFYILNYNNNDLKPKQGRLYLSK